MWHAAAISSYYITTSNNAYKLRRHIQTSAGIVGYVYSYGCNICFRCFRFAYAKPQGYMCVIKCFIESDVALRQNLTSFFIIHTHKQDEKMPARVSRISGRVTADSTGPRRGRRGRRGNVAGSTRRRRGERVMYEDGFHLGANVTPVTAYKEMQTSRDCSNYCSFGILDVHSCLNNEDSKNK